MIRHSQVLALCVTNLCRPIVNQAGCLVYAAFKHLIRHGTNTAVRQFPTYSPVSVVLCSFALVLSALCRDPRQTRIGNMKITCAKPRVNKERCVPWPLWVDDVSRSRCQRTWQSHCESYAGLPTGFLCWFQSLLQVHGCEVDVICSVVAWPSWISVVRELNLISLSFIQLWTPYFEALKLELHLVADPDIPIIITRSSNRWVAVFNTYQDYTN